MISSPVSSWREAAILAALEQPERVAHVFEQQLALARQADAARAAREEPDLQLLLQLFDRLAHRRL